MKYDLLIINGMIIDGTGLSRKRADLAVKDGLVVGIGFFDQKEGVRVIDAEGQIVSPGIVDPHTHYDPQLMFEPYGTSSCYHGVTTVVAGNCGFSIAPVKPQDRGFIAKIFARVEDMNPSAFEAIDWDFEDFPQYLAAREGKLGINMACFIGHCNIRQWVMGEDSAKREATTEEITEMKKVVKEAMEAGAAGLSSTHAPTHWDSDDNPVPSRLATNEELLELVTEAGKHNAGAVSYLPYSSIGGLDEKDGDLLIDMALKSRLPVLIQGLGARNKTDAPTATWEASEAYLDRACEAGAGVYSMLMAAPFNRRFSIADGTSLYDGVPAFNRLFTEAETVAERTTMLNDPVFRDAIRYSVENPNKNSALGSTLPPPHFEFLQVYRPNNPANEKYEDRSLADVAKDLGVAPMDAMIDIALSEDLEVEFVWRTENPQWREGTKNASMHPQMIIGTSDGGAHINRDDGSTFSSYFLRYWVREWGEWKLEDAIRALTHLPAALLGFNDRGLLLPGYAADIMIFDPKSIGPGKKKYVNDFPGGDGRWTSRPTGISATIVNGVPIVIDGDLVKGCGFPGQVVRPGKGLSV